MREVLGEDLLGAYLHGSAVLGGLRRRSDLDVLAVSTRRTAPAEKQRLAAGLLDLSGSRARPARRALELTIVAQPDVRPWRYPPAMDFQYGEWLREEFERGEVEPPQLTNPDLATLLVIVLRGDAPLAGPPPAALLDPVPPGDRVRAMLDGLDELAAEIEPDTRNVVLTLARMWCTAATDRILAKDAAADWALERLPEEHRAVLRLARAAYLGDEQEDWDGLRERLVPHAAHVATEIRRLAAPDLP